MAITVGGTNPTLVTVVSSTVTTNTTFNANAPNDRDYQIAGDIVGTVDAGVLVAGFGLSLQATAAGGGVAMTNNGFVIANELFPALQLVGNGGALTYAGTGTVSNTEGGEGLVMGNLAGLGRADVTINNDVTALAARAISIGLDGGHTGDVTFTQAAGTVISNSPTSSEEVVRIIASLAGNLVANLNGAIVGGGNGIEAAARTTTINFAGIINVASGEAIFAQGIEFVTINVTGGLIHAPNGTGIATFGNGGIVVNMSGGQIGSAADRPDAGITSVANATAEDVDITATTTVFADFFGIAALILDAASTGAINMTANGNVDSLDIGVFADNDGTGGINITTNGTVNGVVGIDTEDGFANVLNAGTVTGTGGTAIDLGAGIDTLTLTPTSVINGNVLAQDGIDNLQLAGSGSGTFDVGDIGPGQQYKDFEIFTVLSGSWTLTGSGVDAWSVSGGTLGGNATIGDLNVLTGATLASGASASELHAGSTTFAAGATYAVEIGGAGAGQFDRLDVSGTVALGGATLNVSLINGFAPAPGAAFTIIENDGVDPIGGTFAGLAEGAGVVASGTTFSISYVGGDGNDVVLTLPAVAVELFGDNGDNLLTGGAANDKLHGLGGNDRLAGGGGADLLDGGAGLDTADYLADAGVTVDLATGTAVTSSGTDTLSSIERVLGSQFADQLRGTGSANILDGAGGDDVVDGHGGDDRLEGGGGNDRINGGNGNDEVIGQSGNDNLDGANGNDLVRGGDGNDSLEGRDGNDRLEGEAGDDTIDAGAGNDLIFGGAGNDRLFAMGGTDTLSGGSGNDLFFYTNESPGLINGDTITDFESVAGQNTGDSLVIRAGFSNIVLNNGSTAITYGGITETIFHPGVTLSLANDILVV